MSNIKQSNQYVQNHRGMKDDSDTACPSQSL